MTLNKLFLPLIAVATTATAGCQQDTQNIERKLDLIIQKLDRMPAGGARAPQQRRQRPQPDRAKTYAISIEGDPFIGPADAKVTLVEAADYG